MAGPAQTPRVRLCQCGLEQEFLDPFEPGSINAERPPSTFTVFDGATLRPVLPFKLRPLVQGGGRGPSSARRNGKGDVYSEKLPRRNDWFRELRDSFTTLHPPTV